MDTNDIEIEFYNKLTQKSIFFKTNKQIIIQRYGNMIIKEKLDKAREIVNSSNTVYKEFLLDKISFYSKRGYFVSYPLNPSSLESFLESVEKNKKYKLNSELLQAHTSKCLKDIHKLLIAPRRIYSDDVKVIIESWVNINNLLRPHNKITERKARAEAVKYHEDIQLKKAEENKRSKMEYEKKLQAEIQRMQSSNSSRPNSQPYHRIYSSHCWHCTGPINSETDTLCPKCQKFYICRSCGYCKCGYIKLEF